ncbi:MAG TPA: GAP family protein [Spirochaetia bacterium]|nr:GAP family protein [Spirochaetia bacterium]
MEINLSLLTAAALTNGLNPCGIGMMITFLGYLIVFGRRGKEKNFVLKTGLVYIGAVFVTYLLTGLLFYGLAYYIQRWWLASVFKYIVGGVLIIAGVIQLKDVCLSNLPIHLRMSMKGFEKLTKLMAKTNYGVTVLIGFLTTVFSTPCMLPLYIGTTAVIARSGLEMTKVLGYFFYYNLIFILPLIVVLLVMIGGRQVVEMKEWEHKNTKWMRFVMGVVLIAVGIWIALN